MRRWPANAAVVATRCGGYVEEVITHGKSGLLVDYSDAASLAQSILQLAESPSHRRQLAQAGRALIEDHGFDINQSTEKLMSAYENLLARPAHSAGVLGIDLFLRVAAETGDLGTRLTVLEDRLKTLEQCTLVRSDLRIRRWLQKLFKQ